MLEWLKRHAWKACNRQNRFAGSNPVLSAKKLQSYSHSECESFWPSQVLSFATLSVDEPGTDVKKILVH